MSQQQKKIEGMQAPAVSDVKFDKPKMPDFIHDMGDELFGDDKSKEAAKKKAKLRNSRLICYCGARGCNIGPMVEESDAIDSGDGGDA